MSKMPSMAGQKIEKNSVKPEDILSDGDDYTILDGNVKARKGSIAAFTKNVDILEKPDTSEQQKKAIIETLNELAPVLVAVGLDRHCVFKNPIVQQIIDNAAQKAQLT